MNHGITHPRPTLHGCIPAQHLWPRLVLHRTEPVQLTPVYITQQPQSWPGAVEWCMAGSAVPQAPAEV